MTLKLKVHSGPATGPADFGLWSGCERVPPGTQVGSDGTRCIIGCLAIRFKSSCPISALKQPFYVFYDGKKLRVAVSIYGLALKIFWIEPPKEIFSFNLNQTLLHHFRVIDFRNFNNSSWVPQKLFKVYRQLGTQILNNTKKTKVPVLGCASLGKCQLEEVPVGILTKND